MDVKRMTDPLVLVVLVSRKTILKPASLLRRTEAGHHINGK